MFEDETAPKRPEVAHLLGQNLDTLSAPELRERISQCEREIERLEAAIAAREATKAAASAFFKS